MVPWERCPTQLHILKRGPDPRSQILGIAKGVALRLRRICSKEEDFHAKSAEYANYLIECGHEKEHVLDKFREVGNISREDARKSKKKSKEGYCCLVTKYNPRGADIRKITWPEIQDICTEHVRTLKNKMAETRLCRVYQKKVNRFEIALSFGKQLLVFSF